MNKPNYIVITPFKRWTIQNFPFIEEDFDAITNYQLLCKIVEYLNKVVANQKELEKSNNELIDAFNSLKNYVDNYFKNLDIQDEINNKLDEMAQSGELTDIIAQYLNLAGVLAFNTRNDLKNADNLVNGSTCYILGIDNIQDGKGAFYKIRNITTSDVIDNYNIIALNNSDTLIAERIIVDETNFNYYLGAFHRKYSESDKRIYLFLSRDGVNFNKIPNIEIQGDSSSGGSDPSIIYDEKTKTFLIAYSNQDVISGVSYCFTIFKSKDLVTWEETPVSLNLPAEIGGLNKWAPCLFRNNLGELCVSFSADKTVNGFDFETLIAKCTSIEDLTFTDPYIITLSDSANIYDTSIVYFNNKYYLIGCDFSKNVMYESTDLTNFTLVNNNVFTENYNGANGENAYEGAHLVVLNNQLFIYAEMPNIQRMIVSNYNINNNNLIFIKNISALQDYKNGSVISINNTNELNVVNKVCKDIINYNDITPLFPKNLVVSLDSDTTISEFTLIPNQIIIINTFGYTLTIDKIRDPYRLYEMNFIIYDGVGKLIINGYEDDTLYSNYEFDGSLASSKKLKTINFKFNALDNSYDYLTKDSGVLESTLETNVEGTIHYEKIGNIVNIIGNIHPSTGESFTSSQVLTTIPENYRIKEETLITAVDSDNLGTLYIYLQPNGNISYAGSTTQDNLMFNITYFV